MKDLIITIIIISLAIFWFTREKVEPVVVEEPLPVGSVLPATSPSPQEEIMIF